MIEARMDFAVIAPKHHVVQVGHERQGNIFGAPIGGNDEAASPLFHEGAIKSR
jgi:hypothetical protein